MTTTIYSSRKRFGGLLGGLLRRNLATGCYAFGAIFFFLTLQYILEIFSPHTFLDPTGLTQPHSNLCTSANLYTSFSLIIICALLLVAPLVLGLSQLSWLHSRRAVDLYHSLPLTRVQLMSACGLTAWLTIGVPLAANYLIMVVAGLIRLPMGGAFAFNIGAILLDLAGWLITEFAILSVIFLVSTQVGNTFENFVFSCELLVAPAVLTLLHTGLCSSMLTGYVYTLKLRWVAYSTPLGMMIGRYTLEDGQSSFREVLVGNLMLTIWLAAGVLLFLGALALYRRRKSELAETSGTQGFLSNLGKVVAVYLGGICIGLLFQGMNNLGKTGFVVGTAMGAVLVFLLVEAVLNRGFKGMKKALPWGAALSVAVTLLSMVYVTGGLGFETRLPRPADVKSVSITYRGRHSNAQLLDASTLRVWRGGSAPQAPDSYYYDAMDKVTLTSQEAVALVVRIHEASLAPNLSPTAPLGREFMLRYSFGGGTMSRRYRSNNALAPLLLELERNPEFLQKTNPLYTLDPTDVEEMTLTDALGLASSPALTPEAQQLLTTALKADISGDNLEKLLNGTAQAVGYLRVDTTVSEFTRLERNAWQDFSLPLFAHYTNTLAAIQSLGLEEFLGEGSLGSVTALGVEEDYRVGRYLSGVLNLSQLTPHTSKMDLPAKEYYRYVQTDPAAIKELLKKAVPAFQSNLEEECCLTLTVLSQDRRGVTLFLPPEDAPPDVREAFLWLYEKNVPATTENFVF